MTTTVAPRFRPRPGNTDVVPKYFIVMFVGCHCCALREISSELSLIVVSAGGASHTKTVASTRCASVTTLFMRHLGL